MATSPSNPYRMIPTMLVVATSRLLGLLIVTITIASAFQLSQPTKLELKSQKSHVPRICRWRFKITRDTRCDVHSKRNNNAEPFTVKEMDEWIWSLSMEPTDEGRREKLSAVFTEKYDDFDFCDLFDRQLNVLGDKVKQRAADAVADNAQNESASDNSGSDDGSVLAQQQEKTPEVKQLWAMIDLMVQKKTLVKRARESNESALE
ncbi:hypothetical protein ACA910_002872 [Epithemia clementina (nom. ined.)]